VLAVAGAGFGTGCGTDDGGAIFDAGLMPCDIPSTFTGVYDTIFKTLTCTPSGCHGSFATAGNLDMKQPKDVVYETLLHGGVYDDAINRTVPDRVKPGDLMASFMWLKVSQAKPPGSTGDRMPLSGAPLTKCQLDAISGWILAGAMND
jgi:hypothetical protein